MSFILYPFVRKAMTIGLLSLFWFGFGSCSHQEEGDTVKMSVIPFHRIISIGSSNKPCLMLHILLTNGYIMRPVKWNRLTLTDCAAWCGEQSASL